MLDLDFGDTPEKLKGEYLGMCEEIQTEIINATRFDENSDLSTTYLGRTDVTLGNIYHQILPICIPTCRPTSEPTYCPVVGQHVY